MNNRIIFKKGTIVNAKKLGVLTFSLGEVGKLRPVEGVIEPTNEGVVIHTKESPAEGTLYPSNFIAVIRILGDKILIKGKYDIYAISPEVAKKKLNNPVESVMLSQKQVELLAKVIVSTDNLGIYFTPLEMRRVIIITEDMKVNTCYNEWDQKTPCHMEVGDVFVVTDEKTYSGYRIGKEEFEETHVLI